MLVAFLKSILIGIVAAAPVGPVAVLVMQKTLDGGRRPGFFGGMGCATVDTIYAGICFFAISIARKVLEDNAMLIGIVGGCIIIGIGLNLILRKVRVGSGESVQIKGRTAYAQVASTTLASPGAILFMFGVCSFFNVEAKGWAILPMMGGVFIGEMLYWSAFTFVLARLRRSLRPEVIGIVNKVAGLVLCLIGAGLMVKGILGI